MSRFPSKQTNGNQQQTCSRVHQGLRLYPHFASSKAIQRSQVSLKLGPGCQRMANYLLPHSPPVSKIAFLLLQWSGYISNKKS